MSESDVIEMHDVTVAYDRTPVLDSVNFTLGVGEFCYVIGKTGAGKSSFLKLLYSDIRPNHGMIRVGDYSVSSLPDKKVPMLRRQIGIVFQDFQLLPDRNVFENVAFALRVTGHNKRFIKHRVLEVLGLVGLSHKRKAMPKDLSGGEQQRVVIARALANEPRLLLADEPTGNLDPGASSSIMELLQQINNRGMAVLMVTHDYDMVRKYPHRTVQIRDGGLHKIHVL
ncbi:cell division ATP-binding protein FtsE [Rhodohalobacter halophilus]|uniref:cell division ATP-binding protein FtsE n=1 Tax=Rhodohalobacter halophilus TaxID=1812810 RepID=UPI00083FDA7B|nr:cell division ATP-binding protein FtsE [Rhodohalobacter halophilus]